MIDLDVVLKVAGYGSIAGGFGAGLRYLGKQVDQMRRDFREEMRAMREAVDRLGVQLNAHGERLSAAETWIEAMRKGRGA